MSGGLRLGAQPARAADAWGPLTAGLAIVFTLFQGLAYALGSDRGQAGLLVAAAVIAALIAVERLLFGQSPAVAMRSLGFGPPAIKGLAVALGLGVLLVAVIPTYAAMRGVSVAPYPGWVWLLLGLFAQAGVAEEALFRGYLFARLRRDRPFWQASALVAVPFVLFHLYLFATLPWPVALASVLLATIISFPLAHLFELGGSTIWPPALLHFTVREQSRSWKCREILSCRLSGSVRVRHYRISDFSLRGRPLRRQQPKSPAIYTGTPRQRPGVRFQITTVLAG